MSSMQQPTFRAVIEKPSHVDVELEPDLPEKPVEMPPTPPPTEVEVKLEDPEPFCCPVTSPVAIELLQALGAAFAVGALTGGLLAYAFSHRTVIALTDLE